MSWQYSELAKGKLAATLHQQSRLSGEVSTRMAPIETKSDVLTPMAMAPKVPALDFQFLGESPAMRALEMAIRDVASSALPVLILGEPGTGKRSLGLKIHQLSPWSNVEVVEVECADLTPEQCTLNPGTGYVMGENRGAGVATILFHEVTNLDAQCQAKLYEALVEQMSVEEQNARRPKLIFTTNRNLEQEIRAGHFREDLYYQISGMCLRIPPLRHRKSDIGNLANRFVANYAALLHRPKPVISESTLRFFAEYYWPGNVRELEDAARTIAAIGDDKVAIAALRSAQRTSKRPNGKPLSVSLKEASRAASRAAEKELILKVLSRTQWNRKRAAEELKISYKALLYKLKQIGMHEPDPIAERGLG
jgi:two-component system response regulator AtoC